MCLKEVGRGSNCLSTLNSALYCPNADQFKSKILAERIKINFEAGKLKEVRKDIAKL